MFQVSQIGNLNTIETECIYIVLNTYAKARIDHNDANLSFNELNNDYEFNNIKEFNLASDRLIDSIDTISQKEDNTRDCINAIKRVVEKRGESHNPHSKTQRIEEIRIHREQRMAAGLPFYNEDDSDDEKEYIVSQDSTGYSETIDDEFMRARAERDRLELLEYQRAHEDDSDSDEESDEEITLDENDGNYEWV